MPYKDKHNPKLMAYQREWQRKYRQTKKYHEKFGKYYKENKERRIAVASAWAKNNPEKVRAKRNPRQRQKRIDNPEFVRGRELVYGKVKRALKSGILSKGLCKKCGSEIVVAHHPDYSKPLEVIWLCEKHHKEIHSSALVEKMG